MKKKQGESLQFYFTGKKSQREKNGSLQIIVAVNLFIKRSSTKTKTETLKQGIFDIKLLSTVIKNN